MIASLRVASFFVNVVTVGGVALLLGATWPAAAGACVAFFLLVTWACGRAPVRGEANESAINTATELATRMGVEPPRAVRTIAGNTAAVVRAGSGYTLLVGEEADENHLEALLAHEIAHAKTGDLLWEPLTDGPARLLANAARTCALFWIPAFPFLLLGAPLARRTELLADELAAQAVASYPTVLKELTSDEGLRNAMLYPSLGERLRHAARHSKNATSDA